MNERQIILELLKHDEDLAEYANGLRLDAESQLEMTEAAVYALADELRRLYVRSGRRMNGRISRYVNALKDRIAAIRASAFGEIEEDFAEESGKVIRNESKFLRAFALALYGVKTAMPDAEAYRRIEQYGIYGGESRKEMFSALRDGDSARLAKAVAQAAMSPDYDSALGRIAKELAKAAKYTGDGIGIMVRGMVNDTAAEFSARNGMEVIYVAALENTCAECLADHLRVFPSADDGPALPRHYNCRCRYIPYMPSVNASEFDLDFADYYASLDEAGKELRIGSEKYSAERLGEYSISKYEPVPRTTRKSIGDVKSADIGRFG